MILYDIMNYIYYINFAHKGFGWNHQPLSNKKKGYCTCSPLMTARLKGPDHSASLMTPKI